VNVFLVGAVAVVPDNHLVAGPILRDQTSQLRRISRKEHRATSNSLGDFQHWPTSYGTFCHNRVFAVQLGLLFKAIQ
jgi:hypothetical protein